VRSAAISCAGCDFKPIIGMKPYIYRRIRPGDVLSSPVEPHAEIVRIERSQRFAQTHWVTAIRDVAGGEFVSYVAEDLCGLPSDMPVDEQLTPRYDEHGHQIAGLATSYQLMKLSEGGKLTPRQVAEYTGGTDRDYSRQRDRAREVAASGSYKAA